MRLTNGGRYSGPKGLCAITTSRGGGEFRGDDGLLSSCRFSDGVVEPDFNESIAAIAASSSGTNASSTLSSGTFLTTTAGFSTVGVRVGVITIFGSCGGD